MKRNPRFGDTLLEIVAASTVIALALAPALRIMRDALAIGTTLETSDVMSTLAASRLEESLATTCATWNTTTASGNYSSLGYPLLKYTVTKSDSPGNGGITNRLIAITSTVWNDTNNNGAIDVGEKSIQYSSKIAKMASYNSGS